MRKRPARVTKKRGDGWWGSPLLASLWGWIPILLGLVVTGGMIKKTDNTAWRELGKGERNSLLHWQLAAAAIEKHDYVLAETEFGVGEKFEGTNTEQVLGLKTETAALVSPEEAITKEIEYWEEKQKTIESRDIYLKLSELYWRLRDDKTAARYLEAAKRIDASVK